MSILGLNRRINEEFSLLLYEDCSFDLLISHDHISLLTLGEDSPQLHAFDYGRLQQVSIRINGFLLGEPATLYDLRARIVKMVDILRRRPKLQSIDISFVDPPVEKLYDRVWADADGGLSFGFRSR